VRQTDAHTAGCKYVKIFATTGGESFQNVTAGSIRKLLNYVRGRRRVSSSEMNPTEVPQYGETVNYVPCRNCGEGSLRYDAEDDVVRCTVCGEVSDADPPER